MSTKTIVILIVIVIILIVGWVILMGKSKTPAPSGTANTGTGNAIMIKNFAFSPAEMSVKTGTTVTWTNQDSAPHTATADDGAFDSGMLNTGQSFSFTFTNPGTYKYHCAVHPNMVASIVVQ